MPAWPGGDCPHCGEHMPENLIHCQSCRALLNVDLMIDDIDVPEFIPLQEITSMVEVEPRGYFVKCPNCIRELRINKKYAGEGVQCKFCQGQFRLELSSPTVKTLAFYANCPSCQEELRSAIKYLGSKVACKLCGAKIHFTSQAKTR